MALRAPLVRLLLHVVEPAPRLFPLDLVLELRALQLEPQAQLVFLVCTQVILLELPGLELGGPFGDELGGGAFGERSLALLIVKLKLRGGGGIRVRVNPRARLVSPLPSYVSVCDDLCPTRAWSARAPPFVSATCAWSALVSPFVSVTRAWRFVSVSTLLYS